MASSVEQAVMIDTSPSAEVSQTLYIWPSLGCSSVIFRSNDCQDFENLLQGYFNFGVPQGSVVGPLLFIMHITPLRILISSQSLKHHLYADDIQLLLVDLHQSPSECFTTDLACSITIITSRPTREMNEMSRPKRPLPKRPPSGRWLRKCNLFWVDVRRQVTSKYIHETDFLYWCKPHYICRIILQEKIEA